MSDWNVTVGEIEFVRPYKEKGVGLHEDSRLLGSVTVKKDTGYTRGTHIGQIIIVPCHSFRKIGILEV